jgi:hypothetical protein
MLQQVSESIYFPLDSNHTCQLSGNCTKNNLQLKRHSDHTTDSKTVEALFDSQPTAEMFGFPSPESTDQH